MQEKRRYPRTSIDIEVAIVFSGRPDIVPGVCRDMSIGGVYVITEGRAAFGSKAKLSMMLPDEPDPIVVSAVVRWSGDDGLGLQFGAMGAKETHAIAHAITKAKAR